MALRLSALLDDPELRLELVAGRDGVDLRGPVRWAHISESPDPTPWLEGGELLLTTGLGVGHDPDLQRRLVRRLDGHGCVAIGFGEGVSLPVVPPAMVAEAEACSLPLFVVRYEVPFVAVTRRVSQAVFEEHYATLRAAVELHRRVLRAVVDGGGVEAVAATVVAPMGARRCLVFDCYGGLLADAGGGDGAATPAAVWAALAPELRRDGDRWSVPCGDEVVTAAGVRGGGRDEVEAVLAVVGGGPLAEHEVLLLEQGVAGVALELARSRSVREVRRSTVGELLADVAAGRVAPRSVGAGLARLGLPARPPHVVLAVRGPASAATSSVCALVEDALTEAGHPAAVGVLGDRVHAVVAGEDGGADAVATAAARRGWAADVIVGRSRVVADPAGLDVAVAEAAAAADAGGPGGVRDVASLGVAGVLAGLDRGPGAGHFVDAVLGPLLDHDRRHGAELVRSLAAYLHHGCRPGPAAEELCVHRHTLAYRLDKVTELTGRSLRSGDGLLELGLALQLHTRRAAS